MVILAAVSGERYEDRVVDVGYDLATAYGDELLVLHVMEREQFEELRNSEQIQSPVMVSGADTESGIAYIPAERNVSGYNLEDGMADAERVATECLGEAHAAEDAIAVTTKGRVGNPAKEILAEADQSDAKFVVVGGRKRSPTGKAIFGSVSQSVILNSERPIVVLTNPD